MRTIKAISGSNQPDLTYYLIVNTIGESMLLETLKMAAYYVKHSARTIFKSRQERSYLKEGSGCYAFIQGSGLDMAINRFALEYDTEFLRGHFNYCLRHSV